MKLSRSALISVFVFVQLVLVASSAVAQSSLQAILDARKPNLIEPQYIKRDDKRQAGTLLIFVHGIFGDTMGTWRGSSGLSLPSAVLARPEFSNGIDAYAFGFPSAMLAQGSFTVTQAAAAFKRTWEFEDFGRYKDVVIVAHSMGGLVSLEALTTYADMRAKVRLLVTYSTPFNGAQISLIAKRVIGNPALTDMFPADSTNGFLNSLIVRWKQYRVTEKSPIFVKCAYETIPFPSVGVIVSKTSGDALCDGPADPIAEDHIGITKPGSPNHESVKFLVNALNSLKLTRVVINAAPPPIRQESSIHRAD